MQDATLILCCGMADAVSYAHDAKERGERIIAASSLHYDESARHYPHWEWLPSVYEDAFVGALEQLVKKHKVARIYCPHNIAHYSLLKLKEDGKLDIPLIGIPPTARQTHDMQTLLQEAEECRTFIQHVQPRNTLPTHKVAAILKQTALTYGESNPSKLAALMAIFTSLPQGDVVEVGSWWGKSAVALIMLAQHYDVGHVLCVDPWSGEEAIQTDSSSLMQSMPGITDWATVFAGFTVHTAAVAMPGRFNYLRQPSVQAAATYIQNAPITSPEFGTVRYAQHIAMIHIDGNHDYASVKADYEAWRPFVVSGGWVILDDYVWLHGEGPQKLGDAILQAESVRHSFVAGKALFLQMP
ncbi:MAG: class I SAM-dependent methyltransferase [Alphaproteobacteria bacterium]